MTGLNQSKKEVPVFDPHGPEYRGKLWVNLRASTGRFRHYFWRRIALVLAVLATLCWVAGTGALWANLKLRRGFAEVHYADLALPWRWPRYITAMSNHYVAMGNDALAHGSPDSALYLYNAALALRPHNPEIRRLSTLAQYNVGARTVALSTLAAGLPEAEAAGDEAYFRQYFSMAFELQADDEAYAAGRALLPAQPDQVRIHQFIAFQLAASRFNRNDYAAAEKWLTDWQLRSAPEGTVLYDQCLWEGGRPESAVADLQDGLKRFRERDAIYAALEQIAHTEHQPNETLHYAVLRQLADADHPAPQLDLVYAYHANRRPAQEHQAVDAYCAKFRADPAALAGLLQFAVEVGAPTVASRVRDLAVAAGQPKLGYALACAEADVVAHDWPAATAALDELTKDKAPTTRTFQAIIGGLEMLIKFGRGDSTANVVFTNFLSNVGSLRAAEVLLDARVLTSLDQPDLAHQLLSKAFASYPDFEPLLIEVVRADLAAKDRAQLADHLAALLKKRKVPRDVLEPALPLLAQPADAALRASVAALIEKTPPRYLTSQRWP
jgi:hypothetical protein